MQWRICQWFRARPLVADALFAVMLVAMAVVAHWTGADDSPDVAAPSAFGTVVVVLATVPIMFRRRSPIATLAVVAVAQIVAEIVNAGGAGWIGVLIALYTMSSRTSGLRRTHAIVGFSAVCSTLVAVGYSRGQVPLGGIISSIVFLVGACVVGDNVQRRRLHVAHLAERAERAERERDLLGRQRVLDERARIARELHDVVAHSVSLMVIQAAAARRSVVSAPEQAQTTLTQLENTGRQAMDELRRVLGVMRTPSVADAGLEPQPSLHNIRALAESDPELRVQLTEQGEIPADVPPSVGLSMYRVVQEALTNVRKHAGQVRQVAVHVKYEPQLVTVQVIDDGRGAAAHPGTDGQGLSGMRERMALCGGSVVAGPRSGGGWQVRASAPLVAVTG